MKEIFSSKFFVKSFFQFIRKFGIELHRYYLVQESSKYQKGNTIIPRIHPVEIEFLQSDDIRKLAENRENDYSEEVMVNMLASGCQCIGIKHNNDIVAYTWYNLKRVESRFLSFPLKNDEAYIYGARTFSAYKGKAIAPYLRKKVYKYLDQFNRTKIYSITLYSNTPAIRLKDKLNAHNLKLYFHVSLFNKFKCNICLKKYRHVD